MLTLTQIENINKAEKVVFTTSNNNQPRSIWVMPSRVESDVIILSNIQMNKTYENIKQNPQCFLNVYMPDKDDLQYKIDGVAKIYESGELFEDVKKSAICINDMDVLSILRTPVFMYIIPE